MEKEIIKDIIRDTIAPKNDNINSLMYSLVYMNEKGIQRVADSVPILGQHLYQLLQYNKAIIGEVASLLEDIREYAKDYDCYDSIVHLIGTFRPKLQETASFSCYIRTNDKKEKE